LYSDRSRSRLARELAPLVQEGRKIMFRSILVPLDGSAFGEHALPLALAIARRSGAALHVVHVHDVGSDRLLTFYTLDPGVAQGERDYLASVAKRLTARAGVSVHPAFLKGETAEVLLGHAAATGADLVAMTTHGRGPLSRFWLGSVADEMARRSPVPLLLVRPQEPPPDLAEDVILRHLLIPLDGSPFAEQILAPAVELGRLMEADYTLLQVLPALPPASTTDFSPQEQLRTPAQAYLHRVAEPLRRQGLQVRTEVVVHSHPAAAILEESRSQVADLICLETHGRRGLPRVFLGSVADKVVRGAGGPVLLHRPRT
jgi:nucleotide-binding universal stress UspA family protein